MTGFSASAPGKAVLCGEYAVLRGAPAVAMAVDRRAGVCLSPADDRCHRFEAPGFVSGHWRFRADSQGRIEWLDEPPRAGFHLLEETFRACLSDELPPLLISIDTREFFDGQSGEKLGFGSSAAATVALVAGLSGQHEQSEACWPVARAVHRSLQGGRGSGVDVATSCFGGVITYRGQSEGPPESQEWPEGLEFRFLYSGRSADTEAAIRKLDDTSSADAAWQNLMAAAENSAAAWGSGNT
jgi:phosphomevalonate kinase